MWPVCHNGAMINIRYFIKENGTCPVRNWMSDLRNLRAKRKIETRLTHLELGNFGDHHFYRMVYLNFELMKNKLTGYIGRDIVLLLCGGNKNTQSKDIELAKKYFKQFKQEV